MYTNRKIDNETYSTFREASNSNWEFCKEYFRDKKDIKLFNPETIYKRKNVCIDGIVIKKDKIFLIEVKRRQVTFEQMIKDWDGELFLEQTKITAMKKLLNKTKKKYPFYKVYIHYITKSSDGFVMLWDLTNATLKFENRKMNNVTYGDKIKINKKVALLNIKNAKIQKTNIIN